MTKEGKKCRKNAFKTRETRNTTLQILRILLPQQWQQNATYISLQFASFCTHTTTPTENRAIAMIVWYSKAQASNETHVLLLSIYQAGPSVEGT